MIPDHIHIQKWDTGYTCCLMTERKTYRLFDELLDGLWAQIKEIIKGENEHKTTN